MDRMISARRQRPDRFLEVDFRRTVSAPIEAVKGIYGKLGFECTDDFDRAMREFLENDRFAETKSYATSLEEFGLDRRIVNDRFEEYRTEFGMA